MMDAKLVNAFVGAIKLVFETMVHTKLRAGKPVLKKASSYSPDVSGVIGFSGDAAGCIILSFPSGVACKVASAFAGIDLTKDHPDFADAIGELANMVAGNAKAKFDGLRVTISLPSVIVGEEHIVSQSKHVPRIVIPCETDLGEVYVEVGMTDERKAPAKAAAMAVGATA